MHRIVAKELLSEGVVRLDVEAPLVARVRKPGQFVIVRLCEDSERLPLTIADSDARTGIISLVIQKVGHGTTALGELPVGGFIRDVAGPLGKPTHIEDVAHSVCVGGGVGTAVVYPIAKAIADAGKQVTAIIGGRTSSLVILEDQMRRICKDVLVTTDDGSRGRKGLVTDALKELLAAANPPVGVVYAVGPVPMMRAVCEVTRPLKVRTIVSLNPIMIDGTGMCGGCRVSVGGKTQFACVDGPEFDGHEVDFAELWARLGTYKTHEKEALCRLSEEAAK